jgi:hypothetical protein
MLPSSLYILCIREQPLVIPRWLLIFGIMNCAEGLWAAIYSTVAQDADFGGIPVWKMAWHIVLSFILAPIFQVMECLIVVDAIVFPPKRFHVVSKV